MFCPQCGKEITPADRFCSGCGTNLAPSAFQQNSPHVAHQSSSQSPASGPCEKPRVWVIILAVCLILTCIGAIIGIPLIVTETKRRPLGSPAANIGWVIAGCIFLGLVLIGMIGNNPHSEKTRSASRPAPSSQGVTAGQKDSEFGVGDTVQLRNHTLTVTTVNRHFSSSSEFDRPQNSSNVFVVVHVVIKNTGRSDLSANPYGFELEDETGTKRSKSLLAGLSDKLETVELSPGGQIEGNIAFEAKADSNRLKLYYSGGLLGGGEVAINLLK